MSVLDTRLTVTEDRISSIISHSRGLHDPTSGPVAHAYTTPYVSISNQGSSHFVSFHRINRMRVLIVIVHPLYHEFLLLIPQYNTCSHMFTYVLGSAVKPAVGSRSLLGSSVGAGFASRLDTLQSSLGGTETYGLNSYPVETILRATGGASFGALTGW